MVTIGSHRVPDGAWGIYTALERLRGYRLAVSTLVLESDPALVRQGLHDAAVAEEQTRSMLSQSNPPPARFDDFDLADLVDPPVTVIARDADALVRRAAERLFGRLSGESGPPATEVLPTQLIVRGSGEVGA